MNFGCLVGSKNFVRLFWVSWEVFVLHGYDCIHCVAKSCTTTPHQWLFRDSLSSQRSFVICSDQVTKLFRSRHDCTNRSSARNPRYFSSTRYRNLGPSESACRHHAYPNRVPLCSRLHWQFLRRTGSVLILRRRVSPWLCRTTFIDQILPEILQPVRQFMQ